MSLSNLFSIWGAALALPCFLDLLCLQVIGNASCNSSSMPCANLGNISYPFWGSASCAASPSYVLSNCTSPSTQAHWDSFSDAALGVVGSPAVTAFQSLKAVSAAQTSIGLSWNASLTNLGLCSSLFPSSSLSLYNIPSSINLTRLPNSSALTFSEDNFFLLFNCTHSSSDAIAQFGSQNFQVESAMGCEAIKILCPRLAETPCIQWIISPSMKEAMLQQLLDSLACSHFMFGIVAPFYEGNSSKWSPAAVEFIWTDIECEKCQNASGRCIYDTIMPEKFNSCVCDNGVPLDFNTQTCGDVDSSNGCCSDSVKTGLGVAAAVVVVGILIVVVKCGVKGLMTKLSNLSGMIREGSLSFTKGTIHISINVLKTTLRKLQSVNVGYNNLDFDGLMERPMEFSYSSVASATNFFTNLVGEGGFGKVYKGTITLADSSKSPGQLTELQVAVKVLEVRSKHSKKQFLNEVVTIGRIHHVNVVRLLGFCMQEDHEMLLYEYVANGSLDRWLFDKKGKGEEQELDWGQRYTIALEIARGLSYLHEECRHRTVHCDIKPQNILLDENMHPKISDFGLAKLMGREESKVVTFARGTPGYMAPEFWMGGESQLSTKYDVYSYGMVLLELISGQRNFRRNAAFSQVDAFPARAFKAAMEGHLESILDAKLGIANDGDGVRWHQIKTATFVALWCIQDQPGRRPHMSEVVKYLEGGAPISECPPQPNITIIASLPSTSHEHSSSNHQDEFTTDSVEQ